MPAARPAKGVSLTIRSWNVDGFARILDNFASIHTDAGSPDVFCLQELRIRPQDASLVRAMGVALPGFDCHYSLCNDPKNATFRGGRMYGVATWVRRRLESVARRFDSDREGRVIVTELRRIAVVNVYAVNGTPKPYFDHELGRVRGDRHAWKRRFIARLAVEADALRRRGLLLVLIGDWNTSRTALDTYPRLRTEEPHARARRQLNEVFIPALDLVDVFRERHPATRRYTWFNRRAPQGELDAARVDFALMSRRLASRVIESEIDDDPAHRYGSDHAPFWISLPLPRRSRTPARPTASTA